MKIEYIGDTYFCVKCGSVLPQNGIPDLGFAERWLRWRNPEERKALTCNECGGIYVLKEKPPALIIKQSAYVITIDIHPCYKFRTVGSDKQLLQIASEFSEVVKAVESGNPTESAYECADLVIATVGYMRFVLGLSETEIADIFQLMNEKNKSRGYLDEVSNQ